MRTIRWHRSKMCRGVLFKYGPHQVKQACVVGVLLLAHGVKWRNGDAMTEDEEALITKVCPSWYSIMDAFDYGDIPRTKRLMAEAGYRLEIIDDINGG